ncbi:KEOPS complex kinase/ATPase Bud32 [Euryarchaeota archaeon]|nr:KEOPS complex kinase/ATPase Bud32 [Euryarchaeota archaeon]
MVEELVPMWRQSEILHQGAEAIVISGYWMGDKSVLKIRNPRSYRHPDLDRRLTRQRLSVEVRALTKLHSSTISCPSLLDVDIDNGWILLSYIAGETLYESLLSGSSGFEQIRDLGRLIRELHELGISHGDLTTHNIMINQEGDLSLIDFGLSKIIPGIEQLGLDLQVLNECLNASHHEYEGAIEVLIEGYLSSHNNFLPSGDEVIGRFNAIRGRVRYHA